MTRSRLLLCAVLLGLALLTGAAARERAYYELPAEARPQHAAHADLRSSGSFGLLCAVAGTCLFLLNLTYLLRKHLTHVRWLGSLRAWMDLHVVTGVLGAGLIVLHSAFLVRSAPGMLASLCLGVVVTTGLVGRYLYSLVPRSLSGRELERAELTRQLEQHRQELAACGVDLAFLAETQITEISAGRSMPARLLGVLTGDRQLRRQGRALAAEIRTHPVLQSNADRVLPLAQRFLRDAQWLRRYSDLRGLMGSWRFLHRWLAIVMLIVVAFHIGIAVRFGDLRLPEFLR